MLGWERCVRTTSCLPLRLGQCTNTRTKYQHQPPAPASTNTPDPLSTVPKQPVQKTSGEQTSDELIDSSISTSISGPPITEGWSIKYCAQMSLTKLYQSIDVLFDICNDM